MYINDITQEQKTYQELRLANPNTSLPVETTNIILSIWYYVTPTAKPIYDSYTQEVQEAVPIKVGERYNQVWEVQALNQIKIDEQIEKAKEFKYTESITYAETLIDAANTKPYVGKVTSARGNKHRVSTRINHSSNGIAKSVLDADRDDALADYTDSIMDADDLARDSIEAGNNAQTIYDIDVSVLVAWPVWVAPI